MEGDDSGAHALELGVLLRHLENARVGGLDRAAKHVARARGSFRVEDFGDGRYGGATGGCATAVAAHSVGDDEQARAIFSGEGVAAVLVCLPDLADVGFGRQSDAGLRLCAGGAAHRVISLEWGEVISSVRSQFELTATEYPGFSLLICSRHE